MGEFFYLSKSSYQLQISFTLLREKYTYKHRLNGTFASPNRDKLIEVTV